MPASAAWRRLRAIVPLTLVALAATSVAASPDANASTGVAGSQAAQHAAHLPPVSFRANHAANVAIAHIGDPYRYGAAGPNSFDCSGLTMFSYAHARLHLPRTAAGQYASVRHILKTNLMRGDLVFFHDGGGHVYHAGDLPVLEHAPPGRHRARPAHRH